MLSKKDFGSYVGVPQSGRAFALPLVAVEPPLASRPFGLQSLTHFAPTLRMAAGSRCAPLGRHPSGKCSGFDWGFGAETMAAPSSPLTPGKPCYPHPPGTRKDQARDLGRKGALPLCTPRQGALPPAPRLSLAARQRGKEDPLPLWGKRFGLDTCQGQAATRSAAPHLDTSSRQKKYIKNPSCLLI